METYEKQKILDALQKQKSLLSKLHFKILETKDLDAFSKTIETIEEVVNPQSPILPTFEFGEYP